MNETRLWITDLLASFSGQENTLTIPRPYITITGSVEAGLLLNQIVYWSDRTKMDNGWFAKSYKEWEDEITLTKRQVSRLIPALQRIGVETKVRRFNGSPTLHWRINKEKFSQSIAVLLNNPKQPNVTLESDKMSFSESDKMSQSSTENTTEITTDKKSADAQPPIKFPSNIKNYTGVHIEAYQQQHTADMTALVKAWHGEMYASITEVSKLDARAYIEVHQELARLHKPCEDYPALAKYTRNKEAWKLQKGGKVSVGDMLKYVTDYKPAPKKIFYDDPAMDLSKPMPNILSKFQQDELERKARENHG